MSCVIHPPSDAFLHQCTERLQSGQLVAFPTETVYGLGANACDDSAVARIYAAKGRPSFNPLIVHLPDVEATKRYAILTPLAQKLAAAFWPGPCTLVLTRRPDCPLSLLVSAGLDTVALRVPAHPVAHQLLKTCGLPLAAPSANRSGRISPTEAAHVASEFGEESRFASQQTGKADWPSRTVPREAARRLSADQSSLYIIDGGACSVGLESTVIDARGEIPVILRPGSVTAEDIATATGISALTADHAPKELHSPGMLASHYAPDRPVRLNAHSANQGEAMLGFGEINGDLNLSKKGDPVEAAANLFAYLRKLDTDPYTGIAVASIPETGLGIAINDRLRRAAAPK